ncbi:MAG: hypothetical protein AAF950_08005 [Pseudomonadota bacterium]
MSRPIGQPSLRLISSENAYTKISAAPKNPEQKQLLDACAKVISATGFDLRFSSGEDAMEEQTMTRLLVHFDAHHADTHSTGRSRSDQSDPLCTAWLHTSYAPLMGRRGKGANVLLIAADQQFHSSNDVSDRVLETLQALTSRCRNKLTILSSNKKNRLVEDCPPYALKRHLSAKLPSLEVEEIPLEVGVAALSSSPELFDVVLVDTDFGPLISNVLSDAVDHRGYRAMMRIHDHSVEFCREPIPRIRHMSGKTDDDLMPILQCAQMLLLYLKQEERAASLQNALAVTIEDRIFPCNDYVDFLNKARLRPDDFAAALIERLGRTPKSLPAANISQIARNAHSVSKPYLCLVS